MAPPITKGQELQLYSIYYTEKFMFGRDKLFKLLQERDISISRRQLQDWLKKQEIYQLYAPKRKTRKLISTILDKPLKQLGIDLIDFQNHEYNGYRYILTCIDLFSKKAYAQPLKTKTDKEVAQAMRQIIRVINNQIHSVRSDNGSEFISKYFKDLMNKHNIKQVFSLPHTPQSNGNIERFNGILKRLILMSSKLDDNFNWPKMLQLLIYNYNQTISTTTKHTPDKIEK